MDHIQTLTLATRLKIPIITGVDAVHGHGNLYGATLFPHHIGLGATYNPVLVKKIAIAAALEVAATGIRWAYAPAVSMCRDPRWGRCYESFGEDTGLVTALSMAELEGWQVHFFFPFVTSFSFVFIKSTFFSGCHASNICFMNVLNAQKCTECSIKFFFFADYVLLVLSPLTPRREFIHDLSFNLRADSG